jgi:hypothetical protein
MTDAEAEALGMFNQCDAPAPPIPPAVNDNGWSQERIDAEIEQYDEYDEEDGPEPGEECGRWLEGKLSHSCTKAGSEECDWECPYRNSLRF